MKTLLVLAILALIPVTAPAQTVEPVTIKPVEFEVGAGAGFNGGGGSDTTRSQSYVKLGYRWRFSKDLEGNRRFATGIGYKYTAFDVNDLERVFAYGSWDTWGSPEQQFTTELRIGYTSSPQAGQGKFTLEPLLRFNVKIIGDAALFTAIGLQANGQNLGDLFSLNPDTLDGQIYGGLRLVPEFKPLR
jgi:hypothetical protein